MSQECYDLLTEHHDIICKTITHMNLDVDEWYDIAAIAACIGIEKYRSKRGNVRSFLYAVIRNAIIAEIRSKKHKNREQCELLTFDSLNYDEKYHSIVHQEGAAEEDIVVSIDIQHFFKVLTPNEGKVLTYALNNYSGGETAKEMRCSRTYVYKIKNKIKQKFINNFSYDCKPAGI